MGSCLDTIKPKCFILGFSWGYHDSIPFNNSTSSFISTRRYQVAMFTGMPYMDLAKIRRDPISGKFSSVMSRTYCHLRARRALLQFKDVPLRNKKALLLYKICGDSTLLVLNGTSLNCNNAHLALNWRNRLCTAFFESIHSRMKDRFIPAVSHLPQCHFN